MVGASDTRLWSPLSVCGRAIVVVRELGLTLVRHLLGNASADDTAVFLVARLEVRNAPNTLRSLSFQCVLCGKDFKCPSWLKRHMDGVHFMARYKCEMCSREFSTRGSMVRHKKCVHHVDV
ncbi:hypothetical protein LSH36_19g07065 [Paralvinella palmiformis]|uniref:C2H2-type domain-containing protein n=1 Tax=Paralvinella palmiformis TaxID=53620 RepID=A0AAD9KAQ4_9ANNE|nr:hypothetical protein LSH36_19g07065 [Paralvinella palmiformis]